MAITLVSTQTRTDDDFTPPASVHAPYKIEHVVDANATTGISPAVFVYAVSPGPAGAYHHVASPAELTLYLTSRAEALAAVPPQAFFRQSTMVNAFSTPSEADTYSTYIWTRLNALVRDSHISASSFTEGSPETKTISAG